MRRRTLLSAAPLAAATAAGLAACGSGSSGGGSNDSPGSLTYWASNQGTSLENDKEVSRPSWRSSPRSPASRCRAR